MPEMQWVGHQDKNGVGWRIFAIPAPTADDVDVYGTMDQTGKRVYDPEPTDVGPIRVYGAGSKPTAERIDAARRQLYERIAKDVENRTPTNSIVVTARPDNSLLVVGVLLALALFARRR
jgi:hypothetical protein